MKSHGGEGGRRSPLILEGAEHARNGKEERLVEPRRNREQSSQKAHPPEVRMGGTHGGGGRFEEFDIRHRETLQGVKANYAGEGKMEDQNNSPGGVLWKV